MIHRVLFIFLYSGIREHDYNISKNFLFRILLEGLNRVTTFTADGKNFGNFMTNGLYHSIDVTRNFLRLTFLTTYV